MTGRAHAITRLPSRRMDTGELTHLPRSPIDPERALEQHARYCEALAKAGVRVHVLEADDALPDCAFVEDAAVLLPEMSVLCRPGARSRLPELEVIAAALPTDRPSASIQPPATLDGGDVLIVGREVFVGRSTRTNANGVQVLKTLLEPIGYQLTPVSVPGALHLKTACTALDNETVLINRAWVDARAFSAFTLIDVAVNEPFAANILKIGNYALIQSACPATAAIIAARGFHTIQLDISEFARAEAGLTCLSLMYEKRE